MAHRFLEDAFGNGQFVQAGQALTQVQQVLVHGSWEGSVPLIFWLRESKEGYFRVVSVEGSRDGVDAVIAYNSLLVL